MKNRIITFLCGRRVGCDRLCGRTPVRRVQIVRHSFIAISLLVALVIVFNRPRIAQDPAYHNMADQRVLLGIPNCLNVLSNVPFAIVGLFGLAVVFRRRAEYKILFDDTWERWPYGALFVATVLTAVGSAFYHLAPDNDRLVWDRLPMTVGFMGLLTAVIAERVNLVVGKLVFFPLLVFSAGSIVYWHWTELHGIGDLRWYGLVQFGSLLLIVFILLLYPARRAGSGYFFMSFIAYGAAKLLEAADHQVYAMGRVVSGHTFKHLAAALAIDCLVAMLRARTHNPNL